MREWIDFNTERPPKDRRFLAKTEYGVEMMEWHERHPHSFYAFYCACACCTGYCSSDILSWMEIPE